MVLLSLDLWRAAVLWSSAPKTNIHQSLALVDRSATDARRTHNGNTYPSMWASSQYNSIGDSFITDFPARLKFHVCHGSYCSCSGNVLLGKDKQKKMVFSYIITSTYEGNSCVQAQHQCYNARSTSPINNELVFTSEKLPNHQSFIFENKTQTNLKDITEQLLCGHGCQAARSHR